MSAFIHLLVSLLGTNTEVKKQGSFLVPRRYSTAGKTGHWEGQEHNRGRWTGNLPTSEGSWAPAPALRRRSSTQPQEDGPLRNPAIVGTVNSIKDELFIS